jgi:serine protease Do
MIDPEQMREAAEQAAREIGRNLPDMMGGMRDGMPNRGRLGVSIYDVTPELGDSLGVKSGVLIASVTPNSAAAKAGLKAGDVITAVNGKSIGSAAELVAALPTGDGSHEVTLTFVREKQERSVKATIEQASPARPAPRRGQPA